MASPPKPYELAREGGAVPPCCPAGGSTPGTMTGALPHVPGVGDVTGSAGPLGVTTGAGFTPGMGAAGYGTGYGTGYGAGYGGGMGYGGMGYGGMGYGGMYNSGSMYGGGMGYGGFLGQPPNPNSLSQHVQVWLAAIQSLVNAVSTFSNLLNATFSATTMSVTAVSEMNRCLGQLRGYVDTHPNSGSPGTEPGQPVGLQVRRNQGGLPWYIWLLLVYTLIRLLRGLVRRLLGARAPVPTLGSPTGIIPSPEPVPVTDFRQC
eukprot:TRINITY_DN12843_c0_g1_i1.p1 TRINITY_DN12843_c0_g1~~TRINITY_DN12843_c0_g1_i1.p1  ORF type:complete len:270 (-),score=18.91 TRINITY_DN12843_c0_g1_i1:14-796(-)